MRFSLMFITASLLTLVGCSTVPSDQVSTRVRPYTSEPGPNGKHILYKAFSESHPDGLFYLSCTDVLNGDHFYRTLRNDCPAGSATCANDRIDLATRYFVHAAMANNVYRSSDTVIYKIPGWYWQSGFAADSGLALDVYADNQNLKDAGRVVVAYRGTESSKRDWLTNFAVFEPLQFKQAYQHLVELRASVPNASITTTGHSLGGAIALNMSMRLPSIDAVAFNPSPNAFKGDLNRSLKNRRTILFEVGEGLTGLTGWWLVRRLPDGVVIGNYNLIDYYLIANSFVKEHSIYPLSRALLSVALTVGAAPEAKAMFIANIAREDALAVDPQNCRPLYE